MPTNTEVTAPTSDQSTLLLLCDRPVSGHVEPIKPSAKPAGEKRRSAKAVDNSASRPARRKKSDRDSVRLTKLRCRGPRAAQASPRAEPKAAEALNSEAAVEDIFIARDGVVFGPYSKFQLRESLRLRIFEGEDLVLPNGETDWRALTDLLSAGKVSVEDAVEAKAPGEPATAISIPATAEVQAATVETVNSPAERSPVKMVATHRFGEAPQMRALALPNPRPTVQLSKNRGPMPPHAMMGRAATTHPLAGPHAGRPLTEQEVRDYEKEFVHSSFFASLRGAQTSDKIAYVAVPLTVIIVAFLLSSLMTNHGPAEERTAPGATQVRAEAHAGSPRKSEAPPHPAAERKVNAAATQAAPTMRSAPVVQPPGADKRVAAASSAH